MMTTILFNACFPCHSTTSASHILMVIRSHFSERRSKTVDQRLFSEMTHDIPLLKDESERSSVVATPAKDRPVDEHQSASSQRDDPTAADDVSNEHTPAKPSAEAIAAARAKITPTPPKNPRQGSSVDRRMVVSNAMPIMALSPPPVPLMPKPPSSSPSRALSQPLFRIESTHVTNNAGVQISKVWRGHIIRRKVRALAILTDYRQKKALVLQCWARRLKAVAVRRMKLKERNQKREAWKQACWDTQIEELGAKIRWQRQECEAAARSIQRFARYVLDSRALVVADDSPFGQFNDTKGDNEREEEQAESAPATNNDATEGESGAQAATHETEEQHQETSSAKGDEQAASPVSPARSDRTDRSRRMELEPHCFALPKKERADPNRVRMSIIIAENNKQRVKDRERDNARSERRTQVEEAWHAIEDRDLDTCAALIQRQYRIHLDTRQFHSRQLTKAYGNKYASVIQRSVRSLFARNCCRAIKNDREEQRARRTRLYEEQQLDAIRNDAVWKKQWIVSAATIMQRWYRWAVAVRRGDNPPTAPPYGLLDEFKPDSTRTSPKKDSA